MKIFCEPVDYEFKDFMGPSLKIEGRDFDEKVSTEVDSQVVDCVKTFPRGFIIATLISIFYED